MSQQQDSTLDAPIVSRLSARDWIALCVALIVFGWGINVYVETIRRDIRAELRQAVQDERERNALLFQSRGGK